MVAMVPPAIPSTGPTRSCQGFLSFRESVFGTGCKVGVNEVGENSAHLGDVYLSRKSCLLSFKSQATRVAPGMMEGGFLKREPLLAGGGNLCCEIEGRHTPPSRTCVPCRLPTCAVTRNHGSPSSFLAFFPLLSSIHNCYKL